MSNYEEFLGLNYEAGKTDCYSIQRRFLRTTYGLELPNFARPERFWEDPRLDLYGRYASQGFVQIIDKPYALGDVLLMPLRTPMVSHAAVIVEKNLVLHHLPGRLSSADPIYPRWAGMTTMVLRHPKITAFHSAVVPTVQFHEVADARVLRDPAVQDQIAQLVGSGG